MFIKKTTYIDGKNDGSGIILHPYMYMATLMQE